MLTVKVISTPDYPNDLRVNANGVNYYTGNNVPVGNGSNYYTGNNVPFGNNVPDANGSNYYTANNVYVANSAGYEEIFEAVHVAKQNGSVWIRKSDGLTYEIQSGSVYVMNDYGQTVSKYVL